MTKAQNIAQAQDTIADIEHSLTNYEIIGWTAVHAEQSQELGWWRRYLAGLLAS